MRDLSGLEVVSVWPPSSARARRAPWPRDRFQIGRRIHRWSSPTGGEKWCCVGSLSGAGASVQARRRGVLASTMLAGSALRRASRLSIPMVLAKSSSSAPPCSTGARTLDRDPEHRVPCPPGSRPDSRTGALTSFGLAGPKPTSWSSKPGRRDDDETVWSPVEREKSLPSPPRSLAVDLAQEVDNHGVGQVEAGRAGRPARLARGGRG